MVCRQPGMAGPHPIHRRFHAEDLVRLRRAGERRRYAASQRAGRIDPNPHQIDAVIFALGRVQEGGCILADEVGLGKTIEAGLVIAQLLAEGATRVLLVVPKPLLGQWRQELYTLFSLGAREASAAPGALDGPGVFLLSREVAGGDKGAAALGAAESFDLCVIDEAHEVFAGIWRRHDRASRADDESGQAVLAGRLRSALEGRGTPVLLLTATPIQNSLAELWGLVQYVDPSGTLLGDLRTFRATFCAGDDRELRDGQEHELRRRLSQVCQRTLRRQAQGFLERPFVARRARLFEYAMSPAEKALYDDVTGYLLEPGICAFRGNHRRLLLLGFHRRMASSVPALVASLRRVAERLRGMLAGRDEEQAVVAAFASDLEDDDEIAATDRDEGAPPDPAAVRAELARVEGFIARAQVLPIDSKAQALLRAVAFVRERGRERGHESEGGHESGHEPSAAGSGKLVVFTESLTTQDYLRALLVDGGALRDDEITMFRGQNDGPRAAAALARWEAEVGAALPEHARPSRAVAMRLALVHEFATRSAVFLSTEAGAKGLNLQFCETLVNYDLPWNPQRIEQRIGRCHRYGQTRDVDVINFLARDNDAQRLTFELLGRKLELFGTVLDASDAVLHEPGAGAEPITGALAGALGVELEASLRRVYERARSAAEIAAGLRGLARSLDERRAELEQVRERTLGLIESRFDDAVHAAFARLRDEVPQALAEIDRDVGRVVADYVEATGAVVDAPGTLHLGTRWCAPRSTTPASPVAARSPFACTCRPRPRPSCADCADAGVDWPCCWRATAATSRSRTCCR